MGWVAHDNWEKNKMSELDKLKSRIDASKGRGIETATIRDDYAPVGGQMIRELCASGDYVQLEVPFQGYNQRWKIFKKGMEPY